MKSIIRNFIFAFRRFKTATVLNILGLSVAFASFILIMMQVGYDYSFDKGLKDYDRIYRVDINKGGIKQAVVSRPLAETLFRLTSHIEAGTIRQAWKNEMFFSVGEAASKSNFLEKVTWVTPSFTQVFHFDMVEGSDKALSEPNAVLISESLAKKIFGKEQALNKQLVEAESKKNYIVGGVYRDFPRNITLDNIIYCCIPEEENKNEWDNWSYNVYIKLDSLTAIKEIELLKNTLQKQLHEYKQEGLSESNLVFTLLPDVHFTTDVIYDQSPKSSRETIAVLFAIAFIIVIIASVNFTNFSMALAPVRIRSINTQKVLGAMQSELRFTLLIEAVCISLFAYLLALVWVYLSAHSPISDMVDMDISLMDNLLLVALTGFLSIITGILSGIYPAFYITSFQPALILKGNFGLTLKGRRLRSMLIGIQFIASLALIMVAAFMFIQNQFMQNYSLGYDKDAIIVTDINNKVYEKYNILSDRLRSFSDIQGVTYSQELLSSSDQYMGWGRMYRNENISYQCLPVDPHFLDVMNIKMIEGRDFKESDLSINGGVYIFNEKAKNQYNLELNTYINNTEIIGFIPDIKFASLRTKVAPMAFYVNGYSTFFFYKYVYVKVKAGSDYNAALENVRKTLSSIDSEYPFNVRFFDDVLTKLYEKEQRLTSMITLFSLVAIIISIVGVFGLVVFENEYRRKEIGIRKVLGSSIQEVLTLLNRNYAIILLVCFSISCPIAYYAVSKWLENFAYRTPVYWWVFALSGLAVALITIVTVSWQSWRAATANPVNGLKNE